MIENFNPFICVGGDNEKINHIAEAAIEMNLTCNDLKKDLNLSDGDVVDMLQLVMDRFKNRNSLWKIYLTRIISEKYFYWVIRFFIS